MLTLKPALETPADQSREFPASMKSNADELDVTRDMFYAGWLYAVLTAATLHDHVTIPDGVGGTSVRQCPSGRVDNMPNLNGTR